MFAVEMLGAAAGTFWLWDSWDSIDASVRRHSIAIILFIFVAASCGLWYKVLRRKSE
jgi:hypothetical protein